MVGGSDPEGGGYKTHTTGVGPCTSAMLPLPLCIGALFVAYRVLRVLKLLNVSDPHSSHSDHHGHTGPWICERISSDFKSAFVSWWASSFMEPSVNDKPPTGNAIPANSWHMGFMWPWIQRKNGELDLTKEFKIDLDYSEQHILNIRMI
jgi:hypothetical protein